MKDYTGPNTLLSAFQLIRKELKAVSGGSGGCVPVGTIVIWSGTANDIPSGWALCDGQDGRPDLRDKFVLGAGGKYNVGATGGAEEVTLTAEQMPAHTHDITVSTSGASSSSIVYAKRDLYQSPSAKSVTRSTEVGQSQSHPNMPPYYALCYIIKTTEDSGGGGSGVTMDQVNQAIDSKLDAYTPQEVYSTEEQMIGTWIDGKPLYRKVFNDLVIPSNVSVTASVEIASYSANVDTVSDIYGVCTSSTKQVTKVPYYISATSVLWVGYNLPTHSTSNSVRIQASKQYAGASITIVLEYTKTTDQAQTAAANTVLKAPALNTIQTAAEIASGAAEIEI